MTGDCSEPAFLEVTEGGLGLEARVHLPSPCAPGRVRHVGVAPPVAMLDAVGSERLPPLRILIDDVDGFAPRAALESFADGLVGGAVRGIAGADHFFGNVAHARLTAEIVGACD